MADTLSAPPIQTPIVERDLFTKKLTGFMEKTWQDWFRSLVTRTQTTAAAIAALALTGQAASLALTPLVNSPAAALYRVTYRVRVTQAATTSSSILVTVTTTDGGANCTNANAAYVGNLTTQPQTGSFLVRTDAGAPISVSTTYASVGGTAMQYRLDVTVESL